EGSRAGTVMYMSPEQANGERLDPRSDLFAVGVVLFEMLSGRRPFEGNTTQTLVDSVMSTNLGERLADVPNLSKPLRQLLERSLQKDRNRRFQSAAEFITAIEKSSAYKLPVHVPAWTWGVIAGAVGIAGFAGFKASSAAGEVKSLEKELAGVDSRLVEATTKAREEASSARQREVDEWKAKHASELSARQAAELAASTALAEKNSADKTLKEKQNEVENLAGQLNAERQAKNLVETAKQTQEQRIQELEKTVAQLKETNSEIERTSKPEARLARSFDELAKVVESGFGESAQRLIESDENVKALAADVLLADFLRALVQATALVETHKRSVDSGGKPHLGALLEAETALVKASERLVAMEANPGTWAKFQFSGQAARERLAEGRRLVSDLTTKIDAQQAASMRDVQASWTALQAKSPIADSAAYFEHLEHYGSPEQLTESVQRLRAELVAQAQEGDTLKPAVLTKATALPEWIRRIDAAGLASSSVTSDVRLFEFARRWYDDDFTNDAFDWTKVQLERATAPTSDWRQVLRLQHALAQPNSAYPTKKSGRAVLREVDSSGRVSWIESLDATPEGDGATKGSWRIKLQTFSAEGRKDQSGHELRMRRVDYSVQSDDGVQVYLDLRARSTSQRVEPLPTLASVDVPAAVLASQELRTFRSAWEEAPLGLCLLVVTDNGQRKRWFSPEFGLVREELAGTLTRDLVYSR
ncbi:MAG: protein kinase, partial [Planctomycetota bacterium]|nr:protein kinase [Planctomycetota bacterium]